MSNRERASIEQGRELNNWEQLPISDVALAMENAQELEQKRELLNIFLDKFSKETGVSLSEDVSSIYQAMSEENLLVRRQRISTTLKSVTEAKKLNLGESKKKYANSVVASNEGIKIALAEGETQGPAILLVGFDVKNIKVSRIETTKSDPRDTMLRSALCRHVDGALPLEDIKYFVFRMPRQLVDERHLTDTEKEGDSPFIFRGCKVNAQ